MLIVPAGCAYNIATDCMDTAGDASFAFITVSVSSPRCWIILNEQCTASAGRETQRCFHAWQQERQQAIEARQK